MNTNMRFVIVHRRAFHERPPVISNVCHLLELGVTPYVITTGLNANYKDFFIKNNIEFSILPFSITKSLLKNSIKGFLWGIKARREIRKISKKGKMILWVEGNYTFTSLSASFINKYPHILQNQELFGTSLKGRYTARILKKIMPTALANLVPEYNRAYIYKALIGLKKTPYIVPNKPAFIPQREEIISIGKKYEDIVKKINGRKVILYQGILSKERNLENYVVASTKLDPSEYVLVLLGRKTSFVDTYISINPNLIFVDYIPAPNYLFFTSLAYVGIVTYDPQTLNTIYCAPNKIYEYGAFNVPIIGNDIPGLRYTIVSNKCGSVCNEDSVDSIIKAFSEIIINHNMMSLNARHLFDSTDNKKTISEMLDNISEINL